MAKTAKGLVEYAKAQLGKPYWNGTFGQTASMELYVQKKEQYPKQYQWDYDPAEGGQKVHDCVGLIKGYLWCDSPEDTTPTYTVAQDLSEGQMYAKCTEKGNISEIPEIPGLLVFKPGHIGVYIGSGKVVEARGHAYGVVETNLYERGWTNWGKCAFISYKTETITVYVVQAVKCVEKKDEAETALAALQSDGYGGTVVEGTVEVEVEETPTEEVIGGIDLPMLQKGSCGDAVKALQNLLIGYGYNLGSYGADGDFGGKTDTALRAFQSARGLAVDGICGPKTWAKLLGV